MPPITPLLMLMMTTTLLPTWILLLPMGLPCLSSALTSSSSSSSSPSTSSVCPAPCTCVPLHGEVHCAFRYLRGLPQDLPPTARRVNLGYNSLREVNASRLATTPHLQMLLLHGNQIRALPEEGFPALSALQVLKLSYNELTAVGPRAFARLPSLSRLHLDHNRLERLAPGAMAGLLALRYLHLQGNRLSYLRPSSVASGLALGLFPASPLRVLHLADNRLSSLPRATLAAFGAVRSASLHSNPWACDCRLRPLWAWVRSQDVALQCKRERGQEPDAPPLCPKCASPGSLLDQDSFSLPSGALVCTRPRILRGPGGPAEASPGGGQGEAEDGPEEIHEDETDARLERLEPTRPLGSVSFTLTPPATPTAGVALACRASAPAVPVTVAMAVAGPEGREAAEGGGALLLNATLRSEMLCSARPGTSARLARILVTESGESQSLVLVKAPGATTDRSLYWGQRGLRVAASARPAWLLADVLHVEFHLDRAEGGGGGGSGAMVAATLRVNVSIRREEDADDDEVWRSNGVWSGDHVEVEWTTIARRHSHDNNDGDGAGDQVGGGGGGRGDDGDRVSGGGHSVAVEGSNIGLHCSSLGRGSPMSWILPDGSRVRVPTAGAATIAATAARTRVRSDGTFSIGRAQPSDSGLYTCVVGGGPFGANAAHARLAVMSKRWPPRGTARGGSTPPPLYVPTGRAASLACEAHGVPVPAVAWLLPDGTLASNQSGGRAGVEVAAGPAGRSTLNVASVGPGDAGVYRCVAVNAYGADVLAVEVALPAASPSGEGDGSGSDVDGEKNLEQEEDEEEQEEVSMMARRGQVAVKHRDGRRWAEAWAALLQRHRSAGDSRKGARQVGGGGGRGGEVRGGGVGGGGKEEERGSTATTSPAKEASEAPLDRVSWRARGPGGWRHGGMAEWTRAHANAQRRQQQKKHDEHRNKKQETQQPHEKRQQEQQKQQQQRRQKQTEEREKQDKQQQQMTTSAYKVTTSTSVVTTPRLGVLELLELPLL
ncbi:immunoglobulin superfamily member 10-like [Lethenteron reissneri]|uniref:immunoglobulin superfamily member 10-like n=1 Tax=Lethenteron reissneri TaxID=7753 RepID=UPI002AB75E17|nr:immunoglobulin superfamily member 10-like [Lethenteron reissneri]